MEGTNGVAKLPTLEDLADSLRYFWEDHSTASLVSIASVVILVGGHLYYRHIYSYWQRRGLKAPKAWPVVGSFLELLTRNRMELENERRDKYGKLYGVYYGTRRLLVVADPEVLRQICVKDFDKFTNHGADLLNSTQRHFIFFMQDDHWKRVRSMMSPTFTSGKIKRMFKLLDVCANDLVHCFEEQLAPGQRAAIVNLKDLYSLYTMDAIASCCYGLKLERNGSTDLKSAATRNEFVSLSLRPFKAEILRFITAIAIPRPWLEKLGFSVSSIGKLKPLEERVEKLIKARLESGKRFDDYLQILLEAKFDDELTLSETDSKENHHAELTRESLLEDQKKLVEDVTRDKSQLVFSKIELKQEEIIANAIFLLMVGLETTATLLTYCTHTLAFHQYVQERLYDEIKALAEYADDDKKSFIFNYESLTSCQYLDAVISETLRVLSPVIQLDRVCTEDYRIEKYNLTVEKGTKLNLAYHAIMNDPDYWPNPSKFDPERFMPENREKIVPGSYCPFGLGPRHCLGMRFSLTETKVALAKMIMNFKFDQKPGTKWPLGPSFSFNLNPPKNSYIKIVKRN